MSKIKTLQIRMDDALSDKWDSACTAREHKYLSSAGVLDSLLDIWPESEASRGFVDFLHYLLPWLNLKVSGLPPSMFGKFKYENGFIWRSRFDREASKLVDTDGFEWVKMTKVRE